MVAIPFAPTFTLERLAMSVSNSKAGCTRFRGVGGRNGNQFDPKFQALVGQKHTQLVERPTIGSAPFFTRVWFLIQVLCDAC
jgi:hypothetical protein